VVYFRTYEESNNPLINTHAQYIPLDDALKFVIVSSVSTSHNDDINERE
jgi:hypothetical protein